jgi:hypothetical protein
MKRTAILPLLLGIAALGAAATTAHAQFGGLGNVVRALPVKPPAVPNILSGPQPVSTNIKDALWGDPAKDGFNPPVGVQQLTSLARSPNGGFVLTPGFYEMLAQSYCLHAGTHGPGGGDGYLYAPVKGSAKDAVESILRNSSAHPEIAQHDIQLLLWAIVAKAKFENLDNRLKLIAAQLLSKKQLASLNRSALSVLTSSELSSLTGGLPGPLRTVVEAESRMRLMMSVPGSSFADIERVAVLRAVRAASTRRLRAGASIRMAIGCAIVPTAIRTRWCRSGSRRAARRSARAMNRGSRSRSPATPPASGWHSRHGSTRGSFFAGAA